MFARMSPFARLNLIIVSAVLISCTEATPYIGAFVMNVLDGILFGLRWLGFSSPIACAAVYGALIGACIGAAYTLRKLKRFSAIRPLIAFVVLLTVTLAAAGGLYRVTMKPRAPVPAVSAPSTQ